MMRTVGIDMLNSHISMYAANLIIIIKFNKPKWRMVGKIKNHITFQIGIWLIFGTRKYLAYES